jgi:hypothetical protein
MVGATGNTTTTTKPTDKKVCVLHKKKQYIWISKKGFYNGHKQHGDKIVDDKYCRNDNTTTTTTKPTTTTTKPTTTTTKPTTTTTKPY